MNRFIFWSGLILSILLALFLSLLVIAFITQGKLLQSNVFGNIMQIIWICGWSLLGAYTYVDENKEKY